MPGRAFHIHATLQEASRAGCQAAGWRQSQENAGGRTRGTPRKDKQADRFQDARAEKNTPAGLEEPQGDVYRPMDSHGQKEDSRGHDHVAHRAHMHV